MNTLRINLPEQSADESAAASEPGVPRPGTQALCPNLRFQGTSLGKILIVDDDRGFVTATSVMLRSAGYTPYGARSCPEALAVVEQVDPDLLLLDVRLQDSEGFVIQEELRKREPDRGRPAIYVTGDSSNWIFFHCIALGGRAVVRKPFEKRELLRTIRSILN